MFLRSLAAAGAALCLMGAVPTGALYVTTLPSSVDVWVDGTYIGHSPLVIDAVTVGRHSLSLTKTGWNAQDLDVSVVGGTTSFSSVQLTRAGSRTRFDGGTIALKGVAPLGPIAIDGETVKPGPDGAYATSAGMHAVAIRTAAGRVTHTVTVYPGTVTDVLLRDAEPTRPAVVAPADDFLPSDAMKIEGANIQLRHGGHEVAAKIGSTSYRVDGVKTDFDAAPSMIGGKLYLPIDLLSQLRAPDAKAK